MQLDTISLKTERLILTPPGLDDAEALLDYYQRNRLNFEAWEPKRNEGFYTLQAMRARIFAIKKKMLD